MVSEGGRLVDVGTDHGYIPIYLVLNKKVSHALAMDINRGPLLRAEENIRSYGLEPYITTRLSDGLLALKKDEGDSLVIAGMGGLLIQRILQQGKEVLDGFSELILEPQSETAQLKGWLYREGFHIEQERLIFEDGKYYPIWRVLAGQAQMPDEVELSFGKELLEKCDPVLYQYLQKEQEKLLQIQAHVAQNGRETAVSRLQEIKKELQLIEAAQKYYETK